MTIEVTGPGVSDLPDYVWACMDRAGAAVCIHPDEDDLVDCEKDGVVAYGLLRRRSGVKDNAPS